MKLQRLRLDLDTNCEADLVPDEFGSYVEYRFVGPVYDAAMAWHEVGTRKLAADSSTSEWWLEYAKKHAAMGDAAKALDAACRRAKEGERG